MFKRILLAADGSEHSIMAAEYALALAEKFDAVTDVVFVADNEKLKKYRKEKGDYNEMERKLLKQIEPVRNLYSRHDIIYGIHLLKGDPGEEIAAFVRQRACDCVIIGNRGLSSVQSLFMGSVSQKVLAKVECPVFIIK